MHSCAHNDYDHLLSFEECGRQFDHGRLVSPRVSVIASETKQHLELRMVKDIFGITNAVQRRSAKPLEELGLVELIGQKGKTRIRKTSSSLNSSASVARRARADSRAWSRGPGRVAIALYFLKSVWNQIYPVDIYHIESILPSIMWAWPWGHASL